MVITNDDGSFSFRVYLPHAAKVELLGDFTEWKQHPVGLRREGAGWWTVSLEVEPGEHLFSYLVDGDIWLADYAAHGVKLNQYGGWVSRLCRQGRPLSVAA